MTTKMKTRSVRLSNDLEEKVSSLPRGEFSKIVNTLLEAHFGKPKKPKLTVPAEIKKTVKEIAKIKIEKPAPVESVHPNPVIARKIAEDQAELKKRAAEPVSNGMIDSILP